jgi:SAM-dependent methyltransferase
MTGEPDSAPQRNNRTGTVAIRIGTGLLQQCRKPQGWLGRYILRGMNRRHAKVTDWGLAHVAIRSSDTVLDIGCGGGRTVAKLAALAPSGKVFGADFSATSVAAARRMNRDRIHEGRVEILRASVSSLPFATATFDLVTAVETHYYWPDLVADCREVLRVLKPGGTFILVAESYRGGKHDQALRHLDMLNRRGILQFAHLTVAEHAAFLSQAGFQDVATFEEYDKGWVCALGRKGAEGVAGASR